METKAAKMNIFAYSKYPLLNSIAYDIAVVVRDKNFHEEISEIEAFTYSSDPDGAVSGKELSAILKGYEKSIFVFPYRSLNPFSKVNGYFNPSKSENAVYINTRRLNRNYKSVFQTVFHEIIHVVDYNTDGSIFDHGGNSARGKQDSAPWKVSKIASRYIITE